MFDSSMKFEQYTNPSDNDTVSIFMRKLPAKVSPENRLGTILTNPGVGFSPIPQGYCSLTA